MKELTQEEIEFIRVNSKGNIDWAVIGWYKLLPEDFIREFQDKFNWASISWKQNLSPEFYFEFYDKVNWLTLYVRKKLYKGYFNNAPKEVKLHILLNYRELSCYL